MEEIDYSEIQRVLDEVLGSGIQFQELAERGLSGEGIISWKQIAGFLQKAFLEELLQQRQMWIHILILAIAAAVLIHFADVFQSKSVSQISFFLIYMILFLLLMASFQGSLDIAREVVEHIRAFMLVLAPAYFLAMTMTSYVSSAGVYYEFILLLITGVQWAMSHVLLPGIEIYVLLVLVNHMSKDLKLGKLAELTGMAVGWSLKGMLALVAGFHMIQGLISPGVDAFRRTAVSRGIDMVPGVGEIGGSVTDMVLGSAMLIKNGIGAAALLVLIFLCLVPLGKLAVIMAAYYLLAAVLQPLSDERIIGCLTGMGNGVKLLFQTVFTVLVLFLLSIAMVTAMTGG